MVIETDESPCFCSILNVTNWVLMATLSLSTGEIENTHFKGLGS